MNLPERDLEALASAFEASWPPEISEPLGPWRLRAAPGGGQRVNSVRCGATAPPNMVAAIASAEAFYEARGLPSLFQVTAPIDAAAPQALEAALAARGYAPKETSALFAIGLAETRPMGSASIKTIEIATRLAALDAFWEQHAIGAARQAVMGRAPSDSSIAVVARDGAILAGAAFVSVIDARAFLHALVVRPAHRRRGVGAALMEAARRFAIGKSASMLVAATVEDNLEARALFKARGLRPIAAYTYWSSEAEGAV